MHYFSHYHVKNSCRYSWSTDQVRVFRLQVLMLVLFETFQCKFDLEMSESFISHYSSNNNVLYINKLPFWNWKWIMRSLHWEELRVRKFFILHMLQLKHWLNTTNILASILVVSEAVNKSELFFTKINLYTLITGPHATRVLIDSA